MLCKEVIILLSKDRIGDHGEIIVDPLKVVSVHKFLHLFYLYFVFETIVHVHSFLDFIRSNFNLCTFYRSVSINQYYYYYYYYIALKYIYLLLRCRQYIM